MFNGKLEEETCLTVNYRRRHV